MKTLNTGLLMAAIGCASFPIAAQELSGSLSAVGDYKAEIRPHSRQSGLPQRLVTTVPQSSLPIAVEAVSVYNTPQHETLTAGPAGRTLPTRYRGYASLAAGSYLNASLSAGYRFIDNDHTTFGAWLQHSSSSLYRPETANPDVKADQRKIYDETISLYGSHRFEGAGTLNASATYRLGYFNYFTSALESRDFPVKAPSQTLNDFNMKAEWSGERKADSFFVNGLIDYRYFGYRRFHFPYIDNIPGVRPTRENDLTAAVTVGYDMADKGAVSLTARAQNLFYIHPHTTADIVPNYRPAPFYPDMMTLRSFGVVRLLPSYALTSGNWTLRAGAKVDLTWDVVSRDDFSSVHIAPDVAVDYTAGKAAIYLKAGGGVTPNTLASRSELDMYQSPSLCNTLPQYSPIDATVGVRLGSFGGFSAGVHASYAIADNTPLSGWYPYWLTNQSLTHDIRYNTLSTLSLKGFSLGGELGYKLGTLLDVNGSLTYQRQSGKTGYFNGIDRPRWTINASADVYPIKGLCIGAYYEYRGVRNVILGEQLPPTMYASRDHNFEDTKHNYGYVSKRLSDVYNLGVHARYTLLERYTFSLTADNLLGCNRALSPLMPEPGFTLTGGFSILF